MEVTDKDRRGELHGSRPSTYVSKTTDLDVFVEQTSQIAQLVWCVCAC